jgi:hypothetical protein
MRGSLHKLTIGEYFYRTTGVITSMNITVDDNYPWEIKMRQPEDEILNIVNIILKKNDTNLSDPTKNDRGQMEVPQILKIQMNFKPIAQHSKEGGSLPQKGKKEPIIVSEIIANSYLQRKDFEFAELGKKATAAPTPASTTPTSTPPLTNTDTTTPAVTTATNDINTAPAVTTTTTQAPPSNSWIPGARYVSDSITGPAGTALWEVRYALQEGFFYWDVTAPDGSVSSSSPSSLLLNVIGDAKIEATEAAGL